MKDCLMIQKIENDESKYGIIQFLSMSQYKSEKNKARIMLIVFAVYDDISFFH